MEQPSRERRDERLARILREQIYSGHPAPGDALLSSDTLAAEEGISGAMAQRAFELLSREGLVRSEQGRGTFVCDRYLFAATVVTKPAGRLPGPRAVADLRRAEPAVAGLTVTDDEGQQRVWTMTVEAADILPAAAVAVAVVRSAGIGAVVSVTVEPG